MKIYLKNIVKFKTGVFSRHDPNPNVFYIQATDFNKQRKWNDHISPLLSFNDKLQKHLLSKGDVLFAAKGKDFFAVVYDEKYSPAVASSTFLILKIIKNEVLPEYLQWYLNHPTVQKVLKNYASGTAINSISINVLENLEIIIPDMLKQKTILEVDRLQKRENKIQKQILKLRESLINEITIKSIE